MQDRPTAQELLAAIQSFLEKEILPEVRGRKQFLTRVAVRALETLQRELEFEESHLREEWRRLAELFPGLRDATEPSSVAQLRSEVREATEHLCAEIRSGALTRSGRRAMVWRHLVATVADKLRISDPQLLERTPLPGDP